MEIPKHLSDEFKELYPQRGAKTKLTVAAIKFAISQAKEEADGSQSTEG